MDQEQMKLKMARVRKLHLFAVILGSLEIVLFAGIIFGWHSVVYIYKDEGYFADLCPVVNVSLKNVSEFLDVNVNSSEVSSWLKQNESNSYTHIETGKKDGKITCKEKLALAKQRGSQVCDPQDRQFNLIFSLSTVITGLMCVVNGFIYDRFGTRVCRIISIVCYLFGILNLIMSSSEKSVLLYPGFIFLSYGGYIIVITNLQLAGLIPHLRSTLMSLYSGSYDTSAAIFLLFKLMYESGGIRVNYCFLVQACLFSIVIASTIFLHRKTHFPWPLPAGYKLHLNVCESIRQKNQLDNINVDVCTSQMWRLNENGSMIIYRPPSRNSLQKSEESYDKVVETEYAIPLSSHIEDGKLLNNNSDGKVTDAKYSREEESPSFCKVLLSPLFIWDTVWMSLQRLRSWYFIGMFNPWITQLACGDKAIVSHYTSFFATVQLLGIFTSTLSGRLMDRKIKTAYPYTNPRLERLHASIASFVMNSTVSVVLSVFATIPVLEVQYVTCILHMLHRSFLYGPNSAFIANAFPPQHFGKLFGVSLTVSALFGMLQFPLFLLMQGPLDNDPLIVNILFITMMVLSFVHPLHIWYYLKKKQRKLILVNKEDN